VNGSTISGSVPVNITANCNAAATTCGFFVRSYLPDGSVTDSLGFSWTFNSALYNNGVSGIGAMIYNIGCGSFAGQMVFGQAIDSFTLANGVPH
jgi:hypothetical protein